jgi:hypothetical protein
MLFSSIGFAQNVPSVESCASILIVPEGTDSFLEPDSIVTTTGDAIGSLQTTISNYEILLAVKMTNASSFDKAHLKLGTTLGGADKLHQIFTEGIGYGTGIDHEIFGDFLNLSLGEHILGDSLFFEIILENNLGDSSSVYNGIVKE